MDIVYFFVRGRKWDEMNPEDRLDRIYLRKTPNAIYHGWIQSEKNSS